MKSGLPRSLIKKYGISKKAWQVYRAGKKRSRPSRPVRIKKTKVRFMARRRRVSRRPYTRTRYVRRAVRRRGGTLTMKNLAMGAAVVAVVEPTLDTLLDQYIPISVAGIDPKDFGKAAIGWYLLKKKGMVKGIGASLMIVGVRNIVRGFTGGLSIGLGQSSQNGSDF